MIVVNGKPLDCWELIILQSCRNPPKKLEPGNYWYDKFAGFWGKQGHKPSQIISANLDVGGCLDWHASNGNTSVYVNGREITKVELHMLKLARVRCYPDTNFWVHDDGSYQEEGLNMVKGSIWGKAGIKLFCSLFSLPFPPKSVNASGGLSMPDNAKQGAIKKFLLVGCSESGTSTIFMQAKFLYKDLPFWKNELNDIKLLIRSRIYGYICMLLASRQDFEDENLKELSEKRSPDEQGVTGYTEPEDEKSIYTSGPGLRAFSDWLLHVLESDHLDFFSTSVIKECAPLVEDLWKDSAFQETLKRTKELGKLPIVANYFLERAVDVFRPNYKPSHMDALYAESFPSSFSYMDFSFPRSHYYDDIDSEDQQDFIQRYRLIKSPSRDLEESYEWLDMSKDAGVVIFSIPIDNYDQFVVDENGAWESKMKLDAKYFASFVTRPNFYQARVLLLLTKYDLFEEKIKHSRGNWFDDAYRVSSWDGFSYIAIKFKRLYTALTGRKLYVKHVNSMDQDSVDAALRYAKEILKWDEEDKTEYLSEDYSCSFEDMRSYSEEEYLSDFENS